MFSLQTIQSMIKIDTKVQEGDDFVQWNCSLEPACLVRIDIDSEFQQPSHWLSQGQSAMTLK